MDNFTGLFIGDDLEYQTYLKNNPEVRTEIEKNTRQSLASTKTTTRISSSDVTPISEDDLALLKRTIPRHDSITVYMQPDIKFYDKFYISDMSDTEAKIPPEIIKNARKIKRIYRGNYLKYIDACCARDEYMAALIDAYGGEEMFQLKYFAKICKDWIPPIPKYAKTSHDYDAVMAGVIDTSSLVPSNMDIAQDIIDSMEDPKDVVISDGPVTSKRANDIINDILDNDSGFGSRVKNQLSRVINLSEADILKSFNVEMGYDVNDNSCDDDTLFSETPESYIARYINDGEIDSENRIIKVFNGEDISSPQSNNRVYDKETGRYMSERELENRQLLRTISASGGWAEHKLMALFNVGTRGERDRLELAARRKNSNKKKKSASMNDDCNIFGDTIDYDDISNVSFNDLSIDDLMRR